MRQETRVINIYKFNELSEDAKNEVKSNTFEDFNNMDEIQDSFAAIAKLLDCGIDYESHDGVTYRVYLTHDFFAQEIKSLSGNRAIAYIWNNYISPSGKGKYLGSYYRKPDGKYIKCNDIRFNKDGYKFVQLYSKLQMEYDNCPFTGVIYDYALWDAWKKFINDIRMNKYLTVDDFFQMLESHMGKMITDDNEACMENNNISELCDANDYEFYEDGTLV